MSIKKGINVGDLVYISAISTADTLHKHGGTRARGYYVSESEVKLSSLVGMLGKLMGCTEPEGKHNKSGMTRAIVRFNLPSNFFVCDEDMRYYNRTYNCTADENKGVKTEKFDVLFSTGVKLEPISLMPSDLRYGYAQHEMIRDYVKKATQDTYKNIESNFLPENFIRG